jgi:hypothetical protein
MNLSWLWRDRTAVPIIWQSVQLRMDASGCKRRRGQILGSARVFPAPLFLLEEDFSRELHGAGVVGEVELLLVELRGGDIDEVTRACSCG